MASKVNGLCCLSLFVLVALFTSIHGFNNEDCWNLYLKSTSVTVVGFEKIEKALIDSGRKLMSTMLRNYLRHVPPYCSDFLFFVDRGGRFTIYGGAGNNNNNTAITLFVPRDEALRIEEWISLESQIVASRVDKRAFETGSLARRSKLVDSGGYRPVVSRVSANGTSVTISGARVTRWGIYDDGHVVVHGTDDFFDHRKESLFRSFLSEAIGVIKLNTKEFEVD